MDDKHKLIVASEVVNDSSDVNQLHAMAKAAKEVLDAEVLQALADEGYYSSTELKACEDDGIDGLRAAFGGQWAAREGGPLRSQELQLRWRSRCLHLSGRPTAASDGGALPRTQVAAEIRYASRTSICRACPLRTRCFTPKASQRIFVAGSTRSSRTSSRADGKRRRPMRRRSAIVEHPFGTLKCRAGYRHFLVRGFDKVRGEWSLMALCYNFTRVLNILGFEGFAARMAKLFRALLRALRRRSQLHPAPSGNVLDKYARLASDQTLRPLPRRMTKLLARSRRADFRQKLSLQRLSPPRQTLSSKWPCHSFTPPPPASFPSAREG